MRKRSAVWGALAIAIVAIGTRANATITQVDGTIVPVTNNMLGFLKNHGEETNSTPPVPVGIDPIADAAESPQVFTPDTSAPVVFEDIGEGAGFENSFGWYNVGDDVQTAAGQIKNLHPVLGVNVDMVNLPFDASNNTRHYGDPTMYIKNAEETPPGAGPGLISVDFAKEAVALRYKGGFISFYLITPEGSPAGDNNGDFTVTAGGKSKLGKIYFTQKDLNNDGDFVHYLTYFSKAKAKTFIFGFEDLFRGGDNDFEDMFIRVTGLTPPCIPTAEVCDGIDNDCDGLIDSADPDLTGVNDDCICDSAADCNDGPKLGECQAGKTVCVAGNLTCHSGKFGTAEICDLKDNNCNGQVDENPTDPTLGIACDGPDADSCKEGVFVCQNGQIVCNDNTGNNIETCNNIDDNCNGQIDEGNPGGGGACGTNLGTCTQGTLNCVGGVLKCQGGIGSSAELCDGLDNDCDGIVDNNPTDVGLPCGTNSTGACKLGQTICIGGTKQCAGVVGPTTETCNNIDDDCDGVVDNNPVDQGQPCGISTGACTPGQFVCTPGGILQCQGGQGPTAEICDGIDNDCDGVVDEDVPGVGSACGASGSGACSSGVEKCISGSLQCVGGTGSGTETCNNIDDDCDGNVDEGDLCNGGICDHGVCAAPCVMSEFPCPPGKKCDNMFCVNDPCYSVTCPPDMDGNAQSCQVDVCAPLCNTITCDSPFVCRGRDGACVPDTCDYLPKCAVNELCVNGQCTSDPCAGVTCGDNSFCRAGTCVASCQGVQCDDGQACKDGTCTATGCATNCATGTVCDPTMGHCVPDMCVDTTCPPNQACDPLTGTCGADPCNGITCPNNQVCSAGQCGIGSHGQLITAGGGGCDATGGDAGGFAAIALVLGALLLRRRRALLLPVVAAASLASAGCKLNNYCIDCAADDAGIVHPGDASDGSIPTGDATLPGCDPNQIRQETCNHADDDCDGVIDEGFDLTSDPLNCGGCGIQCNKPGAQTVCQNSQCVITGCFPGFNDVDGDITGPYAPSNGCEYQCFQSNGGVEACDNLDNNCNGQIDEGIDVSTDPNNCGMCGRTCDFFEATGHCSMSGCSFDPTTDCQPGFVDVDHLQMDGCEYSCTKTNGGVEACDLIDNDCDGVVDNGFDTTSDKNNCGRCGLVCSFANATASCTGATCGFNPATDCLPGFVDLNGQQIDGCEYQCTKTNGGIEICDGKDNDCDGIADETPSDAGGACASTSPPKGACQANGILTCASGHLVCTGATDPTQETCNNIDDDCDGTIDDGVVRTCYDGPANTSGVGKCKPGTQTCAAGTFPVLCSGEIVPIAELCNGADDDCDGQIDNALGGGPLTQSCYSGAAGTQNVGTCKGGTKTCASGTFGSCVGEVDPTIDLCGDNLDTDCDGKNDAAEGCLAEDAEQRLDAAGGALGTAAGAQHSHDVLVFEGGNPFGTNVYAVWNDLVGGATQVYIRTSTDGGKTFGNIVNVTATVGNRSVEPTLAIQPSGTVGGADTVVVAYQNVNNGLRDIFVQRSIDNGVTWGSPTASLDGAPDSFHQAIAIQGSTVVVTWEQLNTATLNRDVVSRTSIDGGVTFKPAMTINVGSALATSRFAGRPQVGITSTGGVVWAWREQRSGATRDIFAAFTAVATTAPVADIRIDGDTAPPNDNRDSDFPVMVVIENAAYLVWQDTSTLANGGSDVIFSRSLDGGATWSTEKIIDDPAAEVSSSFTPTLAVDGHAAGQADDVIGIAWEDRRQGTQVFASISTNGGASFPAAIRASSDTGAPVTGQVSVPSIATNSNGVFVVSWQNQLNGANPHVFTASSIDNGASWTITQAQLDGGAGAALSPHVTGCLVGGKPAAFTAWTDFRTNHIDGDIFGVVSH